MEKLTELLVIWGGANLLLASIGFLAILYIRKNKNAKQRATQNYKVLMFFLATFLVSTLVLMLKIASLAENIVVWPGILMMLCLLIFVFWELRKTKK